MLKPRTLTVLGFVLVAALSRLVPHPWNFTPVAAMALFAGAQLDQLRLAVIAPLAALLISDIFLGFYKSVVVIYACFVASVFIGRWVRYSRTPGRIAIACLVSSFLFFVVTNFACWIGMTEYPKNGAGLLMCYTLALPFFKNTLIGDALFTVLLFGGFYLSERAFPALRESPLRA